MNIPEQKTPNGPEKTSTEPSITLALDFHGTLPELLSRPHRGRRSVTHTIHRRASIKDVIESLGIPHTEIEALTANGRPVSYAYAVTDGDRIMARPPALPENLTQPTLLRPAVMPEPRFLVDVNVGKLTGLLRMLGLDTAYEPGLTDRDLAGYCRRRNRILLTRDTRLLMHANVLFGQLLRAQHPDDQLLAVIRRYGLAGRLLPFSRCLHCNGLLRPIAKAKINHRLLPLTRKYYHDFQFCVACGKLYWAGSHRRRMGTRLETLCRRLGRLPSSGLRV